MGGVGDNPSEGADVVERAKHCRESGNFDALHAELLAEVEGLRRSLAYADKLIAQAVFGPDADTGGLS